MRGNKNLSVRGNSNPDRSSKTVSLNSRDKRGAL
jgi:hypothetical protein